MTGAGPTSRGFALRRPRALLSKTTVWDHVDRADGAKLSTMEQSSCSTSETSKGSRLSKPTLVSPDAVRASKPRSSRLANSVDGSSSKPAPVSYTHLTLPTILLV